MRTASFLLFEWNRSGGRVLTEEVPGLFEAGVFGFGAVPGEEHLGLPSENGRTMRFGHLGARRKIKFPTLSRQRTSRRGWGTLKF